METEFNVKLAKILERRMSYCTHPVKAKILNLTKKILLTARDLALLFEVSERTIYNWRRKQVLASVQMGNRWYYTWNEVIDALENKQLIQL